MSENQSEKKQEISKEPVSDIEIENEKQAEQVKQVVVEAIRSIRRNKAFKEDSGARS